MIDKLHRDVHERDESKSIVLIYLFIYFGVRAENKIQLLRIVTVTRNHPVPVLAESGRIVSQICRIFLKKIHRVLAYI